jgi:hypothetical protein
MWSFIVLTCVLTIGVTRYIVQNEIKTVTDNWSKYRCDPTIMFWASLFKPKDDPRSDTQFVIDNFSHCLGNTADESMAVTLKPVMKFSGLMANSAALSINHGMNLRTISANMWSGLSSIFNIFGSRFQLVFAKFRATFVRLHDAMKKINGIAISMGGAGLSAFYVLYNGWIFVLIIVIIICAILIAILLVLTRFMPWLIGLLIFVMIILGKAMDAMSYSQNLCFHPETVIKLQNEKTKLIKEITINDILADGSAVVSFMKFKMDKNSKMYIVDDIIVSGSHIIYENGKAIFVKDMKEALVYDGDLPTEIYCLNTTSHKIHIVGKSRSFIFADWEELDSNAMSDWNSFVYNTLNNTTKTHITTDENMLMSESGFSPSQKVQIQKNNGSIIEKPISEIHIGDMIRDGNTWTEVTGTVITNSSENKLFGYVDSILMSGASWIFDTDNTWKQAAETTRWKSVPPVSDIFSIFTNSGTFKIENIQFRDFSDIGIQNIDTSYNFTLSRLNNP